MKGRKEINVRKRDTSLKVRRREEEKENGRERRKRGKRG